MAWQWAFQAAASGIIKESDSKVPSWVKAIDELLLKNFEDGSKDIKRLVGRHILAPFAKEFFKEDNEGYTQFKQAL